MFPEVVAQDLWALEKQQEMFGFEDDGYMEVFLKPDKALRRIRQLFSRAQQTELQAMAQREEIKVPLKSVN